jgi:magnesium transporter
MKHVPNRGRQTSRAHPAQNMDSLRKSSKWESPPNRNKACEALSNRLEEFLIFELLKDGETKYHRLNARMLYKHIISAITQRGNNKEVVDDLKRRSTSTNADTGNSTDFTFSASSTNDGENQEENPSDETNNNESSNQMGVVSSHSNHTAGNKSTSHKVSFGGQSGPGIPQAGMTGKRQEKHASMDSDSSSHCVHKSCDYKKDREAVTSRERLGAYLNTRDVRRLYAPFSASNEPALVVRRHVILLHYDPLRAVILRDRLLVLVPDGAEPMLEKLESRIRNGDVEIESTVIGAAGNDNSLKDGITHVDRGSKTLLDKHLDKTRKLAQKAESESKLNPQGEDSNEDDNGSTAAETYSKTTETTGFDNEEWDEMEGHDLIDLPFELQCVDSCLYIISELLSNDTTDLQEATLAYINMILRDNAYEDPLTIIRGIKDAVKEMMSRVKGFTQSLARILNDDEDMALMNLSRLLTHPERYIQHVSPAVLEEESDEPEIILEAYMQIAMTLSNTVDLIHGQIVTASELVDQKLDFSRNRLLLANMIISVFSLAVATTAAAGSHGLSVRELRHYWRRLSARHDNHDGVVSNRYYSKTLI